MSGDSGVDEKQFKGLSKYFNTFTDRGRFNISVTTISVTIGLGLFFFLKSKFTKPKEIKAK